jgi:hypothetical protein
VVSTTPAIAGAAACAFDGRRAMSGKIGAASMNTAMMYAGDWNVGVMVQCSDAERGVLNTPRPW